MPFVLLVTHSNSERIQEWLQNSTEETLVLQANNSFFRRLVYQVIRTDFNDALHAVADTRARTMTVQRMTDEIRLQKEQAKIPKPPMLNLRRVLDMTIEAKKPLIGHNCFLDLMQISQQFLWDVPRELEDWKRSLNLEWNTYVSCMARLFLCPIVMSNFFDRPLRYLYPLALLILSILQDTP